MMASQGTISFTSRSHPTFNVLVQMHALCPISLPTQLGTVFQLLSRHSAGSTEDFQSVNHIRLAIRIRKSTILNTEWPPVAIVWYPGASGYVHRNIDFLHGVTPSIFNFFLATVLCLTHLLDAMEIQATQYVYGHEKSISHTMLKIMVVLPATPSRAISTNSRVQRKVAKALNITASTVQIIVEMMAMATGNTMPSCRYFWEGGGGVNMPYEEIVW